MNDVQERQRHDLRDAARSFLAEVSDEAEVRRLSESGAAHDRALWRRLGGELGLLGLGVDEQYGGLGGRQEQAVVFEEAGRALLCAPLLATATAAEAIRLTGDTEAGRRWLPGIVEGSLTASLAFQGDAAGSRTAQGLSVDGEARFVLDAADADVLFCCAGIGGAQSLVALRTADPGVTVQPLTTMDRTRGLAHVTMRSARAESVGASGTGPDVVRAARDHAIALLAAEQVGGATFVLEKTLEYGKIREQFGRPIGSFQAVKHRCAEMLVAVEGARAAAEAGAAAGPDELPIAAAVAGATCSEAYVSVAGAGLQLHGGIGFTWEHFSHLYLKRARSSAMLLGTPENHRARLADLIGL